MDDLRQAIARAIKMEIARQECLYTERDFGDDLWRLMLNTGSAVDLGAVVDAILALPEIAEALAGSEVLKQELVDMTRDRNTWMDAERD